MVNYWEVQNQNEFLLKIKYEMVKAAIAVMAEAAATVGHAARITYAGKILDGSASVEQMAIGVATNTTIKGHIEAERDYVPDLPFTINSLFNAYAGVSL